MKRFYWQLRELQRSACGTKRQVAFGVRFGYWPCLSAPFAQIVFWHWRAEIWYGWPSYKSGHAP
jgi:hypothetical protein